MKDGKVETGNKSGKHYNATNMEESDQDDIAEVILNYKQPDRNLNRNLLLQAVFYRNEYNKKQTMELLKIKSKQKAKHIVFS